VYLHRVHEGGGEEKDSHASALHTALLCPTRQTKKHWTLRAGEDREMETGEFRACEYYSFDS
jgi:hypothetical protein